MTTLKFGGLWDWSGSIRWNLVVIFCSILQFLPGDSWRLRHDAGNFASSTFVRIAKLELMQKSSASLETWYHQRFSRKEENSSMATTSGAHSWPPPENPNPRSDGVTDRLGEVKAMSAGISRYPFGRAEKQADRRAREVPASYRNLWRGLTKGEAGTQAGATGPLNKSKISEIAHGFPNWG